MKGKIKFFVAFIIFFSLFSTNVLATNSSVAEAWTMFAGSGTLESSSYPDQLTSPDEAHADTGRGYVDYDASGSDGTEIDFQDMGIDLGSETIDSANVSFEYASELGKTHVHFAQCYDGSGWVNIGTPNGCAQRNADKSNSNDCTFEAELDSTCIDTQAEVDNIRIRTGVSSGDSGKMYLDYAWVNVTTAADSTPPTWSSPDVNVTNPSRGDPVNISVVWEDFGGLDYTWLATNETGSWDNKTDYGSPRDISGNGPLTINFTWTNQTGSPRVIGWKIYANDTSGNENGTDDPSDVYDGNFTMWGWSNVTWSSSGGSANVGDKVKLVCFVNDTNMTGSGPINGYNVKFYNETGSDSSLLGTNSTNSTGHAVWYWDTTGLSAGNYYPKCNITDNSSLYYNASENSQANTTVSVSNIIEISLSQALLYGIMFGEVTPNTIGNPARNNSHPETRYNLTVGSSSTQNLDFYVKLNESFGSGISINESSSTTSNSTGFSTNTTIYADPTWTILGNSTHNCTNIAINGNCWMRLYFDVDAGVSSGYKHRNYTICGVVTGSDSSICG